ncbi:hypothetical protein HDU67_004159, partial [Dinochytrium kinnereticum]
DFASTKVAARTLRYVLEEGGEEMVLSTCYDPVAEWVVYVVENATNETLALELVNVLLGDQRVNPAHNEKEALRVADKRGFARVVKALDDHFKAISSMRQGCPLQASS